MIKLTSFNLEKIEAGGKHYALIQNMSLDKKIKGYIDMDFFKWLENYQASNDEKIEAGKMYAIEKDGREYGVVGSTGINKDGYLDVVYAIKKSLRDRGYGKKVLEEITPYLLENIDGIKGINLKIDESNKGSKGVAKRNGYVEDILEKENGVESWYYHKGKTEDKIGRNR